MFLLDPRLSPILFSNIDILEGKMYKEFCRIGPKQYEFFCVTKSGNLSYRYKIANSLLCYLHARLIVKTRFNCLLGTSVHPAPPPTKGKIKVDHAPLTMLQVNIASYEIEFH